MPISPAGTPDLAQILAPIADDMRAVDAVIRERLHSDIALIGTIGEYIIGGGGKRLRPAVLLLICWLVMLALPKTRPASTLQATGRSQI